MCTRFGLKKKKQMKLTFYCRLYMMMDIVELLTTDEVSNWDLTIIKKKTL